MKRESIVCKYKSGRQNSDVISRFYYFFTPFPDQVDNWKSREKRSTRKCEQLLSMLWVLPTQQIENAYTSLFDNVPKIESFFGW